MRTVPAGLLAGVLLGLTVLTGCDSGSVEEPGTAPSEPQSPSKPRAPAARPASLTLDDMCAEAAELWPAAGGEVPSIARLEKLRTRLTSLHERADDPRVEVVTVPLLLALNQAMAAQTAGSPTAARAALRKGSAEASAFCRGTGSRM